MTTLPRSGGRKCREQRPHHVQRRREFPLTVEQIADAARARWGSDRIRVVRNAGGSTRMNIHVAADASFRIGHMDPCVSTDGLPEQQADVAVWLRALLPAGTGSDLIAVDADAGGLGS